MILRERLSAKQALAVALGFAGLLTIVGGGFEAGNGIGNIAAVLSALGFASAAICMRLAPSSNFNPAMVAFGLLSCAVSAGMCIATGSTLLLTPNETLVAFASGFVLIGGGFALYLRGAPWVPAVGQTVLAQTETVFGPIWVWLAFGEAPASTTLIGGAIILIAVLAMAMTSRGSVSHLPTSEL
jgi:drug/metabolite transporter (DMT)-like permease